MTKRRTSIESSMKFSRRIIPHLIVTAALSLLLCAGGCASKFPEVHSRLDVPEREFAMPPKALLQAAKDAVTAPPLSLGVAREGKGWFVTGHQRFPGEWHVARRWQERTNYRVTVVPDFDEPASRARLQVVEQTEQRASDVHDWKPANELNRPQRAQALLREIEKRVTNAAASTPTAAQW